MAAKRKESSTKSITLGEFKAWLQGVEDMQPDNWTPNLEQWKRIREKIALIEESVEQEATQQRPIQNYAPPPVARVPVYVPPATQPFVPVIGETSLGMMDRPNLPNPANLVRPDGIVTPTIDTSNGNYDSMFA